MTTVNVRCFNGKCLFQIHLEDGTEKLIESEVSALCGEETCNKCKYYLELTFKPPKPKREEPKERPTIRSSPPKKRKKR